MIPALTTGIQSFSAKFRLSPPKNRSYIDDTIETKTIYRPSMLALTNEAMVRRARGHLVGQENRISEDDVIVNTFIHSLLSEVSQLQKIQCVWIERDNANPGEREIINPRHIISIKPQIMFTLKAPVGPNDEDVDVDDFDVFFKHTSDYTRSRMTDNYPFMVIT